MYMSEKCFFRNLAQCSYTSAKCRQIWRIVYMKTILYLFTNNFFEKYIQFKYNLAFVWGNHRWPLNSPHKWPVTRSFDVFFHLCLNNGWVNDREASDLRRHRAHHDVIVMRRCYFHQEGFQVPVLFKMWKNDIKYIYIVAFYKYWTQKRSCLTC